MATFTGFEEAIKTYLDKLAKTDKLFAKTYAKPNKSIKECCNYIMSEAKKQAKGGQIAIPDDEIFQLAIHYYDEDDIKAPESVQGAVVAPATKTETKPKTKRKSATKPKPVVAEEVEEEDEFELEIPIF